MVDETSTFVEHENEFLSVTRDLPGRIAAISTEGGGDPTSEVRAIESALYRAKDRLSDMELEVRGMKAAMKRQLGSKIRTYKETLSSISKDLEGVRGRAARSALMSGRSGTVTDAALSDVSRGQRDRMTAATDRMERGTSRLEEARRTLAETEEIGVGITSELSRNRRTLEEARVKVRGVHEETDLARSILRSMSNREFRFKLFIVGIAIILIALIGVIIWVATKPKDGAKK